MLYSFCFYILILYFLIFNNLLIRAKEYDYIVMLFVLDLFNMSVICVSKFRAQLVHFIRQAIVLFIVFLKVYTMSVCFKQYDDDDILPLLILSTVFNLCQSVGVFRNEMLVLRSDDDGSSESLSINIQIEEEDGLSINPDRVCSICLNPETPLDSELKPCGHNFHKSCITEWLSINKSCPNCRSSIIVLICLIEASDDNVYKNA